MRIGILGGTFDPVHYGHLLMAERAREAGGLDAVWLMPAASPPHKRGREISLPKHRIDMLELAVAGYPEFLVDTTEIDRGGTSYTVETLAELREEHPDDEFSLIIGADSLQDLPTWREPLRIIEQARILVVNRGQSPPPLNVVRQSLGEAALTRIEAVEMPGIDISATEIRERAQTGRSLRFMTPRPVEVYIREHQLYQ